MSCFLGISIYFFRLQNYRVFTSDSNSCARMAVLFG
nr:MAG TPA: hypothetical protein [Caudoviricetes sp.]